MAATSPSDYRSISFWHDTVPGALGPRPSLETEEEVDVAIVGAGYTGLWAAYYLTTLEPTIRVAIVDAEIAGFGGAHSPAGGDAARRSIGLRYAIESALSDAGVGPGDIDAIVPAASGVPSIDEEEAHALRDVFGRCAVFKRYEGTPQRIISAVVRTDGKAAAVHVQP